MIHPKSKKKVYFPQKIPPIMAAEKKMAVMVRCNIIRGFHGKVWVSGDATALVAACAVWVHCDPVMRFQS